MTFANLTDFAALDVPVTDPTGRAMVLVVVKVTSLQGSRPERQAPACVAGVPSDPDVISLDLTAVGAAPTVSEVSSPSKAPAKRSPPTCAGGARSHE